MRPEECVLERGAASSAQAVSDAAAERHGVPEASFAFAAHPPTRFRGTGARSLAEHDAGALGALGERTLR